MQLQTQKFRKDINGLRAWAVMAVVLFHFGVTPLQGGFVGVDVFFVLSGYLMTGIIVTGLEKQTFSYWRFLLARASRIFPALVALTLALMILGWFFLPTDMYQELGKEAVYALRFSSNLKLARGAGYFDGSQEDSWLLHAWSLSAEWQFYMLLPLLLMLLWKLKPGARTALAGTMILVVGSLVTSAIMTESSPTKAYFLLYTRTWEMAAGGLVFFASRRPPLPDTTSRICQWMGWLAIFAAMFLFSESRAWPGLWALVPVVGTMLILLANNNDNPLIANPVAQWLGTRSYSIYLWHWPVIVAIKFALVPITPMVIMAALVVTLILSDLSWRLIEIRLRSYLETFRNGAQWFAVLGSLLIVFILANGVRKLPIQGRLSEAAEVASFGKLNKNPRIKECLSTSLRKKKGLCTYGEEKTLGAIIIGDSHSDSVVNAAMLSARQYQKNVGYMGLVGCGTFDDIVHRNYDGADQYQCQKFNAWALEQLSQYDKTIPVLLINRTSGYIHNYSSPEAYSKALVGAACRLAKERPVYLMRPVPEYSEDIPTILHRNITFRNHATDITRPITDYYPEHKMAWDAQDQAAEECGVTILNPLPYLCKEGICYGSKDGHPLYYDGNHINEFGNRFLIPMFDQVFQNH